MKTLSEIRDESVCEHKTWHIILSFDVWQREDTIKSVVNERDIWLCQGFVERIGNVKRKGMLWETIISQGRKRKEMENDDGRQLSRIVHFALYGISQDRWWRQCNWQYNWKIFNSSEWVRGWRIEGGIERLETIVLQKREEDFAMCVCVCFVDRFVFRRLFNNLNHSTVVDVVSLEIHHKELLRRWNWNADWILDEKDTYSITIDF